MTIRVSEVITIDQVKQWEPNDIITIQAGTGAGKSYFIKNILYAHAEYQDKKILFLIHRTDCVNQFQAEIERDNKTDIIEIKTYQSIEAQYKQNKPFDFSPYYYIVCDEFHYFMSDAAFNKTTDISLNAILSQTEQIKIFMSATGDYVSRYISNYLKYPTVEYKLPINFDFIKTLAFFNRINTLDEFIKEAIEKNEKTIFFLHSAKDAYNLYQKYHKYSLFNCSKHNAQYYKYVDENKINDMLQNERFEELILITTTCMDTGVNLIDDKLKHIVCDVRDTGTLIQCIGRKRLQGDNDFIHLHIKTMSNQQLGGYETQKSKKKEKADFLRNHTVKEYIEKYPRDSDYHQIVYDDIVEDEDKGTKKVNELMYFKCLLDIVEIQNMLSKGKYGYCKYIGNMFGFDGVNKRYYIVDEEARKDMINEYLESIVGIKLFDDDQQKLSDLIIGQLISTTKKIDYRTKKLKPSTIEAIIRDQLELPYAIGQSKKETKGDFRGKRYFIITRLNL